MFEIGSPPTNIFLIIKGKVHRYDNNNAQLSDYE